VDFLHFSFRSDWTVNWLAAIIAILEAVLFWIFAAAVFNRRDIAVAVE
jgi:hypothetical protein